MYLNIARYLGETLGVGGDVESEAAGARVRRACSRSYL